MRNVVSSWRGNCRDLSETRLWSRKKAIVYTSIVQSHIAGTTWAKVRWRLFGRLRPLLF